MRMIAPAPIMALLALVMAATGFLLQSQTQDNNSKPTVKLDTSTYWRAEAIAQNAQRAAEAAVQRAKDALDALRAQCPVGTTLQRPQPTMAVPDPDYACVEKGK